MDREPRDNPGAPGADALLQDLSDGPRRVGLALRRLVHEAAPELRETVKWRNPVWVGRSNVVCLMLYPTKVNLGFFQGALLRPLWPELEGTGKGMRHVKVSTVEAATAPRLAPLIRDAVRLDRGAMPLGPDGERSRGNRG